MDATVLRLRGSTTDRAAVLAAARFFREHLEADVIAELAVNSLVEIYEAGTDLCQLGEQADSVIVIVSGSVIIPGRTEDGSIFRPGDVIGDFGLLVGSGEAIRTEGLVAREETIVLEVPYEHLLVHRSSLLFEIGRRVHAAMTAANQRIRALQTLAQS